MINQLPKDAVAEISKILVDGFISLIVTDRKYRGKFKVRMTFKGKYHFCKIIDNMDEYNNAVAELLSQLLCEPIGVEYSNNLDIFCRNLRSLGIGLNRTHYITKSQMITLTKLIQVDKSRITTLDIKWD